MQAVILAAGISKRLRPLTDSIPKCLLNIGDKNLLHRTIENIVSNGINDFIIVTGYRENMIKDYIAKHFSGLNFTFLTNPDYENNNNSYSLWMTKDCITDKMLLFDSDILFDKEIVGKLIDSPYDNCIAVNVTHKLDAEQIKVTVDENDRIMEIGKEVLIKNAAGESIGIEMFSENFLNELFVILDRKILNENNVNEFYEASFQEVINRNEKKTFLYSVDISGYKCIEIDTTDDYNNAQNIII